MTPTREEFFALSGFEKGLFYVLAFLSLAIAAAQILRRVAIWQAGRPTPWKSDPTQWVRNLVAYVLLQRKVRSSRKKSGAPMHLLIFYGFLSLVLATTLLAINTYSPVKFHHGNYYLAYELTFDLLGLLLVIGLVWAILRRTRGGPMPPITRESSDLWALWLLLIIAGTGYWLEGARIAANPKPWDAWSPVGYAIARLQGPISTDLYRGVWWFHMAWVFVFFATFPRMRLRHIAMAILSTAGKPEHPMGRLEPISMEEVERTGQVGVTAFTDYSRWHLMSLDACMECGRCTEVCPAWNAGKTLNPKRVVQDIRSTFVPIPPPAESNVWSDIQASMPTLTPVAEAVTEEALWACTTCNACVEACPVSIRHVDLIVDARRNLVAEGKLSGTAAAMLRQTGSTGHAWGAARNEREVWMEGMNIPLCRNGAEFDVLFWVGCAGATDPGAVKTTKAVAKLLQRAGVKFACLGQEEACTGDPARRTGDEFLFQEKAMENLSVFERYGVKKVVTACPHCFNSLRHEYAEMGQIAGQMAGNASAQPYEMEVLHHTQLLADLVAQGRLKPADGEGVVLHDPCYLGRVNDEADAPRRLLGESTNYNGNSPDGLNVLIRPQRLLEPTYYASKTRCCGAGGGRMWMEEPPEQRPGNRRAEELLATGAKTVALACPFCRIMLDASIKQVTDDEVRLVDLAEMLAEANG